MPKENMQLNDAFVQKETKKVVLANTLIGDSGAEVLSFG